MNSRDLSANKRKEIYFDHAASTAALDKPLAVFEQVSREFFGNPSALHKKGAEARRILNKSRETISQRLGCRSDEFYFTPGGTFSNNLAVFGTLSAYNSTEQLKRKNIVTCRVEHKSVSEPIKQLEKCGVCIRYAEISGNGFLDFGSLEKAIDDNTALVSIMHVNNELGIILPVNDIYSLVKQINPNTAVHCDAVQSFCKIDEKLKADIVSVSGHKIGAVRGVGGILVRKSVRLSPVFSGGGQEGQLAPGTENLAAAASFSEAVSLRSAEDYRYVSELNEYTRRKISCIPECRVLEFESNVSPYILCFSVLGVYANTLLNALSDEGIYVSVGSACSSRGEPNHALLALGFSREYSRELIRVSFSRTSTKDEADVFCSRVSDLIKKLLARK